MKDIKNKYQRFVILLFKTQLKMIPISQIIKLMHIKLNKTKNNNNNY